MSDENPLFWAFVGIIGLVWMLTAAACLILPAVYMVWWLIR